MLFVRNDYLDNDTEKCNDERNEESNPRPEVDEAGTNPENEE